VSRARFRLVVDPVACDGAGVCAELLPEIISLDPWDYPIVGPGEVPPSLVDLARRATVSCPRLALQLVRLEG
jgi:ferredoxin